MERGGRLVLSHLSFTLTAGEILLVSGRNGAGKSTLLRTIAGLLQPAAGRIDVGLATDDVRGVETMHYLGYEDALKPSLTVRENLQFWATMLSSPAAAHGVRGTMQGMVERPTHRLAATGDDALMMDTAPPGGGSVAVLPPAPPAAVVPPRFAGEDPAIEDALAAFGIARLVDLRAGYLSAGQKRRVALARLLLVHRPIWLLDEPLIALDAETQATAATIMARHSAAGGAILLASHQPLALAYREIDLDALTLASSSSPDVTDVAVDWPFDA